MPFDPNQTIAQRTRFTPGERAVLVERAEALKVGLDGFINEAKVGDSQSMIMSMIPCAQEWDGLQDLITKKLARTITEALFDEG